MEGLLFLKVTVLLSYDTFGTVQLVTSQKTQILSDRHSCENLCKFHIFIYTPQTSNHGSYSLLVCSQIKEAAQGLYS
jgi:hypothetical protein